MEIKVLGSGCPNCWRLEALVTGVLCELGEDVAIEHVTDLREIVRYGVFSTPGLVIDGKVKSTGRIPTKAELTSWVTTALAERG